MLVAGFKTSDVRSKNYIYACKITTMLEQSTKSIAVCTKKSKTNKFHQDNQTKMVADNCVRRHIGLAGRKNYILLAHFSTHVR